MPDLKSVPSNWQLWGENYKKLISRNNLLRWKNLAPLQFSQNILQISYKPSILNFKDPLKTKLLNLTSENFQNSKNSKFLRKFIKIDNFWKSIFHNLRHLFKAFQWSDDQIPKLYNTNDRLNVAELLTPIRTSTKQTENT